LGIILGTDGEKWKKTVNFGFEYAANLIGLMERYLLTTNL
jgi:hypothetical protein